MTQEDDTEILYKYMTAARALTCIPEMGDGALRATQPMALNDPFECAFFPRYVVQDEGDEDRKLSQALTLINDHKPVTEHDVKLAREQFGSLYARQLFVSQLSTKYGIISLTTDPLHPLMWSHYTTDGSGFVVGYNRVEIEKLTGPSGALRAVKYLARPGYILGAPVLSYPESNLHNFLSLKSELWAYEDEWRLIVPMNQTIGTGGKDRNGLPINLIRIPNEALVSVHYTERTPSDSVSLVKSRLADPNNRYGASNLQKLILSDSAYGYEVAHEDDPGPDQLDGSGFCQSGA